MESIFLEFCAHCKRKTAHKILPFLFSPSARCRRVKQRCIVRFYKKGARCFPQRRMRGASHSTMPDIYLLLCAIFTSARKKYKFSRKQYIYPSRGYFLERRNFIWSRRRAARSNSSLSAASSISSFRRLIIFSISPFDFLDTSIFASERFTSDG